MKANLTVNFKNIQILNQISAQFISKIFFSILFFIFVLCNGYIFASFEDIGLGARATGMNNAFTAVADDAYSVYYNPAGLNNLTFPEFASTYGKLMMGLDDESDMGTSFLAYSHPLKKLDRNLGTLAIAWQEFKLDSLYAETALYLSYANKISKSLQYGINLKNLRRTFGSDEYTENAVDQSGNALGSMDPVFSGGRSSRALGIDAGIQYIPEYTSRYVFGLSLTNINKPDLGLKTSDPLPRTVKMGMLYKNRIMNFSMDLIRKKYLSSSTDNIIAAAGEKWLDIHEYGMVGVRTGLGIGSREYRNLSFGASYRIHAVQFDYGFSLPLTGVEDTLGSHRVSLSFKFGDLDPGDDIGRLLLEEEGLYQDAQQALADAKRELELARKEAELAREEVDILKRKMHLGLEKEALVRAKKAENRAESIYGRAFKIAYDFYKKRIAESVNLPEQKIILEKIISKYRPTGVSVKKLEEELAKIEARIDSSGRDYNTELKYYKKMKRSGATEDDSRAILNRIIKKYRSMGVDTLDAEEALIELGRE
ncbi:MAG: hypothetical protein ABII23_00135 [bacterium]